MCKAQLPLHFRWHLPCETVCAPAVGCACSCQPFSFRTPVVLGVDDVPFGLGWDDGRGQEAQAPSHLCLPFTVATWETASRALQPHKASSEHLQHSGQCFWVGGWQAVCWSRTCWLLAVTLLCDFFPFWTTLQSNSELRCRSLGNDLMLYLHSLLGSSGGRWYSLVKVNQVQS